MKTIRFSHIFIFAILIQIGCVPTVKMSKTQVQPMPSSFSKTAADTANIATVNWKEYFNDTNLVSLVEEALKNNQGLNIVLQEIAISQNEVRARKGEYLPFVGLQGGAGIDKVGQYTRFGSVEENLDVKPGKKFPKPFSDYTTGLAASWELDVWKKLRNAKKAAVLRYLSSIEGKNFVVTNLVGEVAGAYYELLALDNLLEIIQQNIDIQGNALKIVKQEKESAKVTQLAINRFEAQLLNTQNLQYEIKQRIVEAENKINFLVGRYPQSIARNPKIFNELSLGTIKAGIPSQLLSNRTDLRQAELELEATKLDVKAARANFYPSFRIKAGVGFQAFKPRYLLSPESIMYSLAGDLVAPLVNRNSIKATYFSANSKQIQSLYRYERTILNAYVEVANQLAKTDNYTKSYETKQKEVDILSQSINISNSLFSSARADYMEVLLTQREALNEKLELVEIKTKLLGTKVGIYRALGGGWK